MPPGLQAVGGHAHLRCARFVSPAATVEYAVIDRRAVEEGVGQLRPDARADGRYGEAVRVPESLLPHLRRSRDLVDRCYAEPLDLDGLAAAAHISKFHFVRCFTEVYGTTPAAYVAERRIERAQDLLRATNLTVTEVCMLVGYSSLGSFSTKFRQLVGVSPSTYQGSFAATGAPHIPGCYVFMLGLHDRAPGPSDDSARTEKRRFAGQS